MPSANRPSCSKRGYSTSHQRIRRGLLANLKDGELCYWCGLAMFKEPARNWDKRPLAADHVQQRAAELGKASRLLHFYCNSQRGGGQQDGLRPVAVGVHPTNWAEGKERLGSFVFEW